MNILYFLFLLIFLSCSKSPTKSPPKNQITPKLKTSNINLSQLKIINIQLLEYYNQPWQLSFVVNNQSPYPISKLLLSYGACDQETTITTQSQWINVTLPPNKPDQNFITFSPPKAYSYRFGFTPFIKIQSAQIGVISDSDYASKYNRSSYSQIKTDDFRLAKPGETWIINESHIPILKSPTTPRTQGHLRQLIIHSTKENDKIEILETPGLFSSWTKVNLLNNSGLPYASGWIKSTSIKDATLINDK